MHTIIMYNSDQLKVVTTAEASLALLSCPSVLTTPSLSATVQCTIDNMCLWIGKKSTTQRGDVGGDG